MKKSQYADNELAVFCTGLAHLLHAGLTAGDALTLLDRDGDGRGLNARLGGMARLADEGMSLSRILEETGGFPAYVRALVRAGEETGRLEEALTALGEHYEEQDRLDRDLRAALTYPLLLLGILAVVVAALLIWVLPVFDDVYRQLGSSLTGIAGGLLALGGLLRRFGPVLLLLLALGAAGFVWLSRSRGAGRLVLAGLGGRWRELLSAAGVAGVLTMGLRSGLDPESAMELVSGLAGEDAGLARRCDDCMARLRGQESLPSALRESGLLPAAECRLLEAGMRSGCADTVMAQIARRLRERGQAELEVRLGRIEPALVLTASVLVGAVLLCVLLPLTRIMAAIG